MGKSTINGHFSIAMLVITRGYLFMISNQQKPPVGYESKSGPAMSWVFFVAISIFLNPIHIPSVSHEILDKIP